MMVIISRACTMTAALVVATIGFASPAFAADAPVTTARALEIVTARCVACHSAKPTLRSSPPKGLILSSEADLRAHAGAIFDTVSGDEMPPRNATKMTEDERAEIARWFNSGEAKR